MSRVYGNEYNSFGCPVVSEVSSASSQLTFISAGFVFLSALPGPRWMLWMSNYTVCQKRIGSMSFIPLHEIFSIGFFLK